MTVVDVLCIGDLDVDMYISVPAIPGFDQKVAGENHGRMPGGMSANCAVAVARLGLRSRLLAAVGSDASGMFAKERIAHDGVDTDHLVHRADTDTFMCVVLLSPSGEKSLIKLETDAYLPRVDEITDAAFSGVRHLHMTYGDAELSLAALAKARAMGLSTSLDLEPPDILRNPEHLPSVLALVDTLFLNREAFDRAGDALGAPLAPSHLHPGGEILVTLGAAGCRRLTQSGMDEMPGFKVSARDTTGAGDCFAGAYLVAKLMDATPLDAMRSANAAAALATLSVGAQTAMPDRASVDAFLRANLAPLPDTLSLTGDLNA